MEISISNFVRWMGYCRQRFCISISEPTMDGTSRSFTERVHRENIRGHNTDRGQRTGRAKCTISDRRQDQQLSDAQELSIQGWDAKGYSVISHKSTHQHREALSVLPVKNIVRPQGKPVNDGDKLPVRYIRPVNVQKYD